MKISRQRYLNYLVSLLVVFTAFLPSFGGALPLATASQTLLPSTAGNNPSSVTIAGSFQKDLGCGGDWDPGCTASDLTYDATDDVWQKIFTIPGGNYEYKAALNHNWDVNYGLNTGGNIPLNLSASTPVKFYFDNKTHWVTDNHSSVIATVPGSFQQMLGCPGDWQPDCLLSWLEDPGGNGSYSFETTALLHGSYEGKVAINEGWDVNYGQDGVPGGANIGFTVPTDHARTKFVYNPTTHVLTISSGHSHDNNVEYSGLGHNSQDLVYRQPFGAINPNTPVTLRFRTFHNDATSVQVRFFDTAANRQFFQDMYPMAQDIDCLDVNLANETCDFWETKVTPSQISTLYYRFIISDGTSTAYYADDTFKDGGWGTATNNVIDNSYAITVFDPAFKPIPWLKDAVIYQIFPDRFRNGRSNNDPNGNEPRYGYPPNPLDKILPKSWFSLPEGYCRNYALPTGSCTEQPRGRDYFGGDLKGIDQQLGYLKSQGVNTLYLNPIFDSGSNHGYDTQNYYQIDPFFGTQKDWENLTKHATQLGMRIILDGVFNHVSSDSPYFDRYKHYPEVGACESVNSPYRSWFYFQDQAGGPCAGPNGPNTMTYTGWFGFDSIPVLNKNVQAVRDLIYAKSNSVAPYWLQQGAAGWRLDVMGDGSFPTDFWQQFRQAVKKVNPDAPIIGELWKKDEMLPKIQGDQADTGMNYRFRNAILGLFGKIDNKGFPDDGQADVPPSSFVNKMNSVREDYPDATYYTLMNLMDSHDTQRILWSLTPGQENRQDKEFNAANLALGKQRLRLAALVQFSVPGAPTIYYGDEVGVTGADDPDDRRTFPWNGDAPGGDAALMAYYQKLASIRSTNPVLRDGALKFLLADDTNRTLAYGMRTQNQVAIVAVNRDETGPKTLTIPLTGYLRDNVTFTDLLGGGSITSVNGKLVVTLPALGGAIFRVNPGQNLVPPAAPTGLKITAGDASLSLSWNSVAGAAGYNIYRSYLSGGGYQKVNSSLVNTTSFTDSGLRNAYNYYYVVKAVDSLGNESSASVEAGGTPHYIIGWANLQWPPTLSYQVSTANRTDNIYGQVWIDGLTNQPGSAPTLKAQVGFGPSGSNPAGNSQWTWVDASFNTDSGNNDEFVGSLQPQTAGSFDYAYRYSTTNGQDWLYADLDGTGNGYSTAQAGKLTATKTDNSAPSNPTGLNVVAASAAKIELAWNSSNDNAGVYGYEVLRSSSSNGAYNVIGLVTGTAYTDSAVTTGASYYYVVRAVDTSWNRSGNSNQVSAIANPRTVTVQVNVTVPASTDATGKPVHIAGSLSKLNPALPDWDPASGTMTRVDATHWSITLTGTEGTQIEYKYVLGDWNYVEKDAGCQEVNNRQLTLSYGSNGTQTVNDTVANWRNVSPCGN